MFQDINKISGRVLCCSTTTTVLTPRRCYTLRWARRSASPVCVTAMVSDRWDSRARISSASPDTSGEPERGPTSRDREPSCDTRRRRSSSRTYGKNNCFMVTT